MVSGAGTRAMQPVFLLLVFVATFAEPTNRI
jgi:hypothetical protein